MFKRVRNFVVLLSALSRAGWMKLVVVVVLWASAIAAVALVISLDDSTAPVAIAHAVGDAQVRSHGGAGTARLGPEDARRIAAAALSEHGSSAFANLGRTKDGKSVSMSDVPLKEIAFIAGAWEVRSNSGSLAWDTNSAADVWLLIYRLEGVTVQADGWEGVAAVVEFGVIISDNVGTVEMVAVNTFNPNPQAPAE